MNPFKYIILGIKTIIIIIFSLIKYLLIGLVTALTIIPKYIVLGIRCLFDEKMQKELKLEDKIIPTIIITLSITTYLLSIFILTRWYVQNERNKKFDESLIQQTEEISGSEQSDENYITPKSYKNYESSDYPSDLNFLSVNLDYYIAQNSETVAFIQVNGTNIKYPVVKHTDNSYYLNHDFYKRKTDVGSVFADYRDDFDNFNNNTIIYAHNLINRTMFGQIPYLLDTKWQSNKNNYYIKLSTKKTNTIWQIFSVYKIKPTTDYLQSKFNSKETYRNFINTLNKRTEYNFNTPANENDTIITLSTCDDIGTKRIVVHAKLIKSENK